ncbi:MAG: phage protein Gp27 family protein [Gammaproteobacteria bacterium]
MPKASSVTQLDPAIREAVNRAIREERATIDQIVALIEDMGGEASRSAVGRYKKNAEEQMEIYREAQEVAKVWIGKLEEDPESDIGRLLSDLLRTVAYQTMGTMKGGKAKPAEVMYLAKALKEVASADKISTERELKIRQEVAKKAADKAETVGRQMGLSADQQTNLKKELLGIVG